ncbi:MAG: FAD binding domain-containing protein [Anaerolineales bacterium]
MWDEYINAFKIDEVIQLLHERNGHSRIIAGATDLVLEIEHGLHPKIDTLIDISRIKDLDSIFMDDQGVIHIGPLATHNHCVSSKLIRTYAYPLARACWEVGAPQIRNRGTIAGNLITASPANDTITPLIALNANVILRSIRGERTIPLADFYTGVRRTVMEVDEMLVDITFKAMHDNQRGSFLKMALRRAQAISVVNVAVILTIEKDTIKDASITLGAVAPTIIHATKAEKFLINKPVNDKELLSQAALLAMEESKPINDLRASARYRKEIVRVLTLRLLRNLVNDHFHDEIPDDPVLLWGTSPAVPKGNIEIQSFDHNATIQTTINGIEYEFKGVEKKTLLRLLREDAGLIGTKEGCAEGECGACTVFLDGKAVMACLVPAARAHGATIITVEGLATEDKIHPVQEAFIEEGAVQCGYCTPGFVMSAAKLLEEYPIPSQNQIQQAFTGNLCRCTGYYNIISAVEKASKSQINEQVREGKQ